jgi:CO/xanthine dehydrogenase FAD-binding subunit
MIEAYFRPETLEEAVALLQDKEQNLKPLGGGTFLSRQHRTKFGVVDLQNIGLDQIEQRSGKTILGAAAKMHALAAHPNIQPEIKRAVEIDASENIRNMASMAGWLVSCDGRSVLSTVLLALDADLTWAPEGKSVRLGDWFPIRKQEQPGVLITHIEWHAQTKVVFEYAARSPKDRPILIVAAAQWSSGRTRIALGGFGAEPIIAMDGPESGGAELASRDAYADAGDQWASAAYRQDVAAKLALRCLERLDATDESEV